MGLDTALHGVPTLRIPENSPLQPLSASPPYVRWPWVSSRRCSRGPRGCSLVWPDFTFGPIPSFILDTLLFFLIILHFYASREPLPPELDPSAPNPIGNIQEVIL